VSRAAEYSTFKAISELRVQVTRLELIVLLLADHVGGVREDDALNRLLNQLVHPDQPPVPGDGP
jgi:hypothetical protein